MRSLVYAELEYRVHKVVRLLRIDKLLPPVVEKPGEPVVYPMAELEMLGRAGSAAGSAGETTLLVAAFADRHSHRFGFHHYTALAAALAQLPLLDRKQLCVLTWGLGQHRHDDGAAAAVHAIVRHPACDESLAAQMLIFSTAGHGDGGPLDAAVAAAGWLAPAALRIGYLEQRLDDNLLVDARIADAVAIVAELELGLGPDRQVRDVAASLGPGWAGSRAELLRTARSVSCAPAVG